MNIKHRAAKAEPGESMIYHVGMLARDCGSMRGMANGVPSVQRAALALACQGTVDLVQRRVGPQAFQYIAIKRREAPASLPNWYGIVSSQASMDGYEKTEARRMAEALA